MRDLHIVSRFTYLILFFTFFFSHEASAQWLDWKDVTSTNLVLSTVANSDDEEKDISAADLDKDGFTDIIVVRKEPFSNPTQNEKSDLLLMNEGGVLVDRTVQYAPEFISNPSYARDLIIADFDGDTWEDIVIANTFDQEAVYYRNQGNDANGNWLGLVDETATRLPPIDTGQSLLCAIWNGDINGDGFDDLYLLNYQQSNGTAFDYLFINDGNGVFTNESQSRLGNLRNSAFGTAVEIVDIDNDGDMDVVKTSALFSVSPWNTQGIFILYNDGTGNFSNWQHLGPSTQSYMFTVLDLNSDGMKDIVVVDDATDYQLIATNIVADSNITYNQTSINSSRTGQFGGNIHSADLDLDGDIDVGIADVDVDIPPCDSGRSFALLENDNGVITDPHNLPVYPWSGSTYDYAFFDLNNDGLQDMLLGRCEGYDLLLSENCDLITVVSDFDGDGLEDACDPCPTVPDIFCVNPPNFPTVDPNLNIAHKWNEMLLASIRGDFARPTVHARNLFHSSIAMWDSWTVYNSGGCPYMLGNTVEGFQCQFDGINPNMPLDDALEMTMSYAMYRLLSHRFANAPSAADLQTGYDWLMDELGYDISITSTNYSDDSPAKLGNAIADCMIQYGLQDGANEQNAYGNTSYTSVNQPLIVDNPGNPTMTDYNRWQELTLDIFIDQSGNVIPGATPEFLSPEWGQVNSFALDAVDLTTYNRNGFDYLVHHDPGAPPLYDINGGLQTNDYRWGHTMVALWSGHLDSSDPTTVDISPGAIGNGAAIPTSPAGFPAFYDWLEGGSAANGHSMNPVTGAAYTPNVVSRGDFARVLAEFWADGPDSETPPGHWFTLLNHVAEHPDFEKRFEGSGPILDDTEWFVKAYLAMGGAMHDSAISAWGVKGWYDYPRPVSSLRAMGDLGQSSNPALPNYHVGGLTLVPGKIELIGAGDPLVGAANEHLNKLKVMAWRGHSVINNVDTDTAGVGWIRVEDWVPYQRPSFVTPPFAGYVSGHSTFSRAAAEVMTLYTGNAFFPGGMGTFLAEEDEFLVFEDGPSQDVTLQWATYRDAADQSALSRIWGGIHPPADDAPGRLMGEQIGIDSYNYAKTFFTDSDGDGVSDNCDNCVNLSIQSTDYMPTDNNDIHAKTYIEGFNLVPVGSDIEYDAGDYIDLKPGFTAEQGSFFEALLNGCDF